MQEHLTWNIHINELVTSCYGALAVLNKLRNLAPLRVKKQLLESLILSKSDYAIAIESTEALPKIPKCMCGICLRSLCERS